MKKVKSQMLLSLGFIAGMAILLNACSKSSGPSLPPINGYNSSDDVASANLLAHWSFENSDKELKSGVGSSSSSNTSYVAGEKGQALHFANGHMNYPNIPALSGTDALASVTVSMWVNVDNNGSAGSAFFALTNSDQSDWNRGPILMMAETGHPVTTDDTLVLHSFFSTYPNDTTWLGGDNINDYGVRGTDFQTVHGTNKWVHYVMRYDGSGSNIDIYADGVRVSNNNFRNRTTGTPAVGLGNIRMRAATQVLLGAFPNSDVGYASSPVQSWQGQLTGSVDEIRVYNKALSDTEIGSLYQLESAGR